MIIHKYITHILDKSSDTTILNDFEGKINADIDKFLQKSIKKITRNELLRKSKFRDYSNNYIKNICETILYNEKTFIENSKEIAVLLFDVMKTNIDINSCDLVVSLITVKDEKYIVIIKFDYKSLYNHHITVENEKFNIQMLPNEIGISATAKIKQAAIIGVSGLNDEYDLRVLDVDSERDGTRSSFKEDFLNIENIEDDTYKTREFERISNVFITNALSNDIKKAEDARSIRNYMLKENSVMDIEKFCEIALDEDIRESFIEHLEDNNINLDFNINKKYIEKKLRNRRIKTDTGFDIKGNLEYFNDPLKFALKKNTNGGYDIVIKNIKFYEEK